MFTVVVSWVLSKTNYWETGHDGRSVLLLLILLLLKNSEDYFIREAHPLLTQRFESCAKGTDNPELLTHEQQSKCAGLVDLESMSFSSRGEVVEHNCRLRMLEEAIRRTAISP